MSRSDTAEAMATTIGSRLDDDEVVEAVCHRERRGHLDTGQDVWTRYDSLAELPGRPLDGWEELVVHTATHVYRQVGVGYGGGVTVVPRTPEAAMAGEATDSGSVEAAADD